MIKNAFSASFTACPPDKRHRDLDNIPKTVFDLLQKLEIIENDRFCVSYDIRWGTAEECPMGLKIVLTPKEPSSNQP